MYYNAKVIISLLTLVTMAVIVAFPTGAYAVSVSVTGDGDGQKITVVQEYTYKAGEAPDIHDQISQFGHILKLASVSEPVESSTLPDSRSYTYLVPLIYSPDQLSQAPANVELTPVYGDGKRQVDRLEAILDLLNNDVEKLPLHKAYTDTIGRGPGADANGTLTLAEVKYVVTSRDKDGLPDKYTAHVVYRGEEAYQALLYYSAEATYTNTAAGVTTYTVVATYEGVVYAESETGSGPASTMPDGDHGSDSGTGSDSDDGTGLFGTVDEVSGGKQDGLNASWLPFSPATISPLGTAALAAITAAALVLLVLIAYNNRRLKESSC